VTIRGHSFDFKGDNVAQALKLRSLRKLWLFPHFAGKYPHPKVAPLTCCYDDSVWKNPLAGPRTPVMVFRTAAGVAGKDIEGFMEIARALPGLSFRLVTTRSPANPHYPDQLGMLKPVNVTYETNLPQPLNAEGARSMSIYVSSYDPNNHPYGMPLSIAETMALGLHPLAPRVEGAKKYVGDAGTLYGSRAEAVAIIDEMSRWPEERWQEARRKSLERAKLFTRAAVLTKVLDVWNTSLGHET
jgi:hypothetical protein